MRESEKPRWQKLAGPFTSGLHRGSSALRVLGVLSPGITAVAIHILDKYQIIQFQALRGLAPLWLLGGMTALLLGCLFAEPERKTGDSVIEFFVYLIFSMLVATPIAAILMALS